MRTLKKKRKLQGAEATDPQNLHKKPDLVDELIGEEKDNEHTHKPDGTYEILNEIVVDRGPNPSRYPMINILELTPIVPLLITSQQCLIRKYSATTSISPPSLQMVFASPRRQAQRHITSQRAVLSATLRTP